MVKLIGKSKKRRGLGVIENQGQDIKTLQRAPQGITAAVDTASTIIIKIAGRRYRVTATRLK